MEKSESKAATRRVYGAILLCFLALFVAAAASIPFVYESQTLWYRFGFARTVLLTGQVAGALAGVSLLVQLLLGVRGRFLERIFGAPNLLRWHKINGVFLAFLAVTHASLILKTEELSSFMVEKNWPELVGAALLASVLTMVFSSLFRQQLGFVFLRWRLVHRVLGYLAPLLAAVHILNVSDSFAEGLPRVALLVVLGGVVAAILGSKRVFRRQGV